MEFSQICAHARATLSCEELSRIISEDRMRIDMLYNELLNNSIKCISCGTRYWTEQCVCGENNVFCPAGHAVRTCIKGLLEEGYSVEDTNC